MSIFDDLKDSIPYTQVSILVLLVIACFHASFPVLFTLLGILTLLEFRLVIEKFAFKLSGDIDPKVKKVVDSINKAHENDRVFDERLTEIESKLSALNIKFGVERFQSE